MNKNSIIDPSKDVVSITDVGKVREANEDNLGYSKTPNGDVFVVCDGMGGHVGGQVASSIAVDSIMEYFNSEEKENTIIAINEALIFANKRIIEKWAEQPDLKGMGTTAVIVVIRNGDVFIGHVGDSRAYLFTDKKLYRVTKDHSYVQGLVDNGIIKDEEAELHPRKSELTKALGIKQIVEPTITNKPLQLVNGDRILMCSDGLCGLVNDPTMEQEIAKNDSIRTIGESLVQMALNAGGHDNITLHLFEISNSKYTKTIFEDIQNNNVLESTLTEIKSIDEKFNVNTKWRKILLISIFIFLSIIGVFITFSMISKNKSEVVISTVPISVDSIKNNSTSVDTSISTFKIEVTTDVEKVIHSDNKENSNNNNNRPKIKKEKKKEKSANTATGKKVKKVEVPEKKEEKKEEVKVIEETIDTLIKSKTFVKVKTIEKNSTDSSNTKQNKDK